MWNELWWILIHKFKESWQKHCSLKVTVSGQCDTFPGCVSNSYSIMRQYMAIDHGNWWLENANLQQPLWKYEHRMSLLIFIEMWPKLMKKQSCLFVSNKWLLCSLCVIWHKMAASINHTTFLKQHVQCHNWAEALLSVLDTRVTTNSH